MDIKQFFTDERAVSPVIGVILMVAITVILAAVIGTFVLGLGQNVNSAPQAQLDFSFNSSADDDANRTGFNITHTGGDQLENSTVSASHSGGTNKSIGTNAPFTAGDEIVNGTMAKGDTVRLIYSSPDSGSTTVLGQQQAPS